MTAPTAAARTQPAGGWSGADPRYRGYRPDGAGVRLDHRVRQAVALVPAGAERLVDADYVLYAAGLLAAEHPGASVELARRSLAGAAIESEA